jgi:hypothetical protein
LWDVAHLRATWDEATIRHYCKKRVGIPKETIDARSGPGLLLARPTTCDARPSGVEDCQTVCTSRNAPILERSVPEQAQRVLCHMVLLQDGQTRGNVLGLETGFVPEEALELKGGQLRSYEK